ncbi:hypothetical protein [Arcanobacterium canis]
MSTHISSHHGIRARAIAVVIALVVALGAVFVLPVVKEKFDSTRENFSDSGQLLVVGIPGLRWDQVGADTPNIDTFTRHAAVANLIVVRLEETACPDAGWLTLNTGQISQAPSCETVSTLSHSADPLPRTQWDTLREANSANPFRPDFGLMARALEGKEVAAIGRGGAIVTATANGSSSAPSFALGVRSAAQIYADEGLASADVVFADLGPVALPHADAGFLAKLRVVFGGGESAEPGQRTLREVDRAFGELVDAAGSARVMLIAPGDTGSRARGHVFAYGRAGGGVAEGSFANSWSTRQPGLLQLTDVVPTIVRAVGGKPSVISNLVGSQVWKSQRPVVDDRRAYLVDAEKKGALTRSVVGIFYALWALSACVSFTLLWRCRVRGCSERTQTMTPLLQGTFLSVAALPVASFLINCVPWWRAHVPVLVFVTGVCMIACVIGVLAQVSSRFANRRGASPFGGAGIVALVTATTIGVDAIFGSALHSPSVLGDQPQSGGRFYGLSNAPFTVFAVSMIVLAMMAAHILVAAQMRVFSVMAVVACGIIATVIDGSSSIGADFGGVPALVVAFSLLTLLAMGKTVRLRTVIAILAGAASITLAAAFVDWLRPPASRTHLGKFFESVVTGDAFAVIGRKLGFLFISVPVFVWILVALVVAGGAWYVARQMRAGWHPDFSECDLFTQAAIAIVALAVGGFALNDSGLVLPMAAIFVAVPLLSVARGQQSAEHCIAEEIEARDASVRN